MFTGDIKDSPTHRPFRGIKAQSPILSAISLPRVTGFLKFGDCVHSFLRRVMVTKTGIKTFICVCLTVALQQVNRNFLVVFPFSPAFHFDARVFSTLSAYRNDPERLAAGSPAKVR